MAADRGLAEAIRKNVTDALAEDLRDGDLTAALIPASVTAHARILSRDPCILAGRPWVEEVVAQVDADVALEWHTADGQPVAAGDTVCLLSGPARSILSAERTALNFLQLLSGTATTTRQYVDAVAGTGAIILDTRKTLPGLRIAQKYAVRCGGGENHRIGLFDAILIKENHIESAGGIEPVLAATAGTAVMVEIEVESLEDLRTALGAGATRIMLDNFSLPDTREAVRLNREDFASQAKLEASGGKTLEDLRKTAEAGVDYISVGALTKNVASIDLSMRVQLG
jgi:nicotinate-nucleotide pyrophosphorylase (carboxylating)